MPPIINTCYGNCSDEVLLQAIIQKEMGAFEALYDRHASPVYNLLIRIVHEENVAEELVQDTFWQVWQKASQYNGAGAGISWLHRIARNKALDQLRRQKADSQPKLMQGEPTEWPLASHQPSAESEFEQVWTCQQVRQALAQIPCEQRLCLELAYFEGLSHQEIAEQIQAPIGTIKTRIRIGMQKVERWLLGCGYTTRAWPNVASAKGM